MSEATTRPASHGAVLDAIRNHGTISRVELASELGLTAATISNAVKQLLKEGLVIEAGFAESTGGKPREMLRLNEKKRHAIGVDFDQTRVTAVVTDMRGAIVGRSVAPWPDGATGSHVAEQVSLLLRAVEVHASDLVGLGVAVPPDVAGGGAPTPWSSVTRDVSETLGLTAIHRDQATCAALGEYWTGQTDAGTVSASLYMGERIDCGFLVNGRAYAGANGVGGSLGHISIAIDGPVCPCGRRGCLDLYASPQAVVHKALSHRAFSVRLALQDSRGALRANFDKIGRAAMGGDILAHELIQESAEAVAVAAETIRVVLHPERLYLSGPGFTEAGALYRQVINASVNPAGQERPAVTQIRLSALDMDAAAIGAATLALQNELAPR